MDIALPVFALGRLNQLFKPLLVEKDLPSKPPKLAMCSAGFGQKLFERSEFFWPR